MAKIMQITKANKLDKRTTSGIAASGKSRSSKTLAKKIMKGNR